METQTEEQVTTTVRFEKPEKPPLHEESDLAMHSEELNEVMGEVPGWILRWGLLTIFLLVFGVVLGSYFFRFREVVSAPLIITTTNPPAPILSGSSGRIAHLLVDEGESVEEGTLLAVLEERADYKDILEVHQMLKNQAVQAADLSAILLKKKYTLGDVNTLLGNFLQACDNVNHFTEGSLLPQKIDLLEQRIVLSEQNYKITAQQLPLLKEELALAKRNYKRQQQVLERGGISEAQFEAAKLEVMQKERNCQNFDKTQNNDKVALNDLRQALLELKETYRLVGQRLQTELKEAREVLLVALEQWERSYLLVAPMAGKVTFTQFWGENQVIANGARLATIVPATSREVVCRAKVASSGIAKVELGQKVHVKLAGYPYMQHGLLEGKIKSLSKIPEGGFYVAEIGLTKGMQSNYHEQLKLVQEMEGTAEIITKEKRAIQRFLPKLNN